jgi:hypothetical protein
MSTECPLKRVLWYFFSFHFLLALSAHLSFNAVQSIYENNLFVGEAMLPSMTASRDKDNKAF